jgi:hypothetical protein
MTELTEKAIATEQNQIKALEEEYQKRTQEYLAFQVDSALDYKGSESVLEDWDNCPEILIRLIIQLQRHTKAVCTHLKQRSLEETTESLRSYAEDNFYVSFSVLILTRNMLKLTPNWSKPTTKN